MRFYAINNFYHVVKNAIADDHDEDNDNNDS